MIDLQIILKHEGSVKIFFEIESICGGGFGLEIWYEASYPATYFNIIHLNGDELDVARIIFEDISSVDYSYLI